MDDNLNKKIKYDYSVGREVENRFIQLLLKYGYTDPTKADWYEDTNEHWDIKVTNKYGKTVFIDVKGIKDEKNQLNWIEFRNVKGKKGWLFGKADYIAFERNDCFMLIDRKILKKFALSFIINDTNKSKIVSEIINDPIGMLTERSANIEDDLYKRYKRVNSNRDDVVMLVRNSDLQQLNPIILKK